MKEGGVSASLQSIGDSGYVEPEAARAHDSLLRGSTKAISDE